MNRISEAIKKIFPNEFEELVPVKKRWWHRIDLSKPKGGWKFWLGCLITVGMVLAATHYYNFFIMYETQVITDKAQIEAQLQRRKNLMLNLTKTVIDYAEHERNMFIYMADKRAHSLEKTDMLIETLKKEGLLDLSKLKTSNFESDMAKLMALAEAYPQLKLSGNFQKLMDALMDIENRIVERRMAYNSSCNVYTTYIRKFPQNIFAFMFRFKSYPFVEVDKDVGLFNIVEY